MSWSRGVGWVALLEAWLVLGIGYSAAQTPTGCLLRRSRSPEDRPALWAAQFARSYAAWLVTYSLAGRLGARPGRPRRWRPLASSHSPLPPRPWPSDDPDTVEHAHPALDPAHPHLASARGHSHAHADSPTIFTTTGRRGAPNDLSEAKASHTPLRARLTSLVRGR